MKNVNGVLFTVLFAMLLISGCGDATVGKSVVLFAAHDEIFSRPIAEEYQTKSGVVVQLKTDLEAAKTVGLVNRLIARKDHPEADVFWNNELAQTLVLKEQGVLEPYVPVSAGGIPARFKDSQGWWTGFSARARVILYNTDVLKPEDVPRSIFDLTEPRFKGRVVIARPLFGTSFTHAAALFSKLGSDKAKAFYRALKANDVKVVPGNAMAKNLVASGEYAVCITDTDDVNEALIQAKPVRMVYPDQAGDDAPAPLGALVIPNTVALVKGGPNPQQARKLIDYLVSAEVEGKLAKCEGAQMPLRPGIEPFSAKFNLSSIKSMDVDWADVARQFSAVKAFVEEELQW